MFNVKISLLYFLLICLSVVAITLTVGEGRNEAIRQAENTLKTLPGLYEDHKRLREKRLKGLAVRVGGGELLARLQTLKDFRAEFIEIDKYICSPETGVKCDLSHPSFSTERARIAEERYGDTTFAEFADSLAERVREYHPDWRAEQWAEFKSDTRKRLKDCFGRGSTQCDWQFAYDGLKSGIARVKRDLGRVGDEASMPDLILVFDSEGIGLANANNDSWSYRREYVKLVEELKQFVSSDESRGAGSPPVYYTLLNQRESGDTEFLVGLVPVVGDKGDFLGAVLVGESITGKMVEAERAHFDKEVTYILDDKPLASTLDRDQYQFMLASAKKANRMKVHLLSNPSWLGISTPYYNYPSRAPRGGEASTSSGPTFMDGVAYGKKYQDLRVVLATPRAAWIGSLGTLQTLVPLFGLGVFLLGVVLFWLLVRNHTKPFEKIDAGIHEVINGNFDYQFPFDYNEELPSSMAQSLNLMVAVLTGKPLPEDEDASVDAWDSPTMPPEIRPVPPASALVVAQRPDATPPPDFLSEPAETYYQRLYDEYRKALTHAEAPSTEPSLTYVQFVEQLVQSERRLRSSLGCKHVRFKVGDRDGQVILVPVPVS